MVDNLRKTPRKSTGEAKEAAGAGKKEEGDLAKHFKSFMNSPGGSGGGVKRVRSFSQPKDRAAKANKSDKGEDEEGGEATAPGGGGSGGEEAASNSSQENLISVSGSTRGSGSRPVSGSSDASSSSGDTSSTVSLMSTGGDSSSGSGSEEKSTRDCFDQVGRRVFSTVTFLHLFLHRNPTQERMLRKRGAMRG